MAWGWVNHGVIFIFGWTIPLIIEIMLSDIPVRTQCRMPDLLHVVSTWYSTPFRRCLFSFLCFNVSLCLFCLVWLDDWSTVSNAVSWLWLALFVFLLISIPPLCCMPPGLTSPALAHSPHLPPPAPPAAPPPSAQTAISDRRGAWEVQPNRQTNSSYLTSHLAADRHGGSVQVLLHPSLDDSSCVRSCLRPSAASRGTPHLL